MMAADYRHIGGRENRLGRHYSRFLAFWPAPALAGQSLALRKLSDAGSNRRSRGKKDGVGGTRHWRTNPKGLPGGARKSRAQDESLKRACRPLSLRSQVA